MYSFINKNTAVMYTVNNYTYMWERRKLNNKILNILYDRLLTHQWHLPGIYMYYKKSLFQTVTGKCQCNYFFTSGVCKLQRKAHTLRIWLDNGFKVKGIVLLKMLKFFNLSMARSTWIRRLAIRLVLIISLCNSLFPLPQLHF